MDECRGRSHSMSILFMATLLQFILTSRLGSYVLVCLPVSRLLAWNIGHTRIQGSASDLKHENNEACCMATHSENDQIKPSNDEPYVLDNGFAYQTRASGSSDAMLDLSVRMHILGYNSDR